VQVHQTTSLVSVKACEDVISYDSLTMYGETTFFVKEPLDGIDR